MIPRHIFTFWEPADSMPAYLKLCLNTWKTNAPDFDITLLDHSNVKPFLHNAAYPIDRLLKLPLQIQKDAIEAAVLSKRGGIFMDVDTMILSNFEPVLEKLQQSDIVLFSSHLAFMAARPDAVLIQEWSDRIKERLEHSSPNQIAEAKWDFVGNSITDSLFKKRPASLVTRLEKNKYAFTPETLHYLGKGSAIEQYRKFWFDPHDQEAPYYQNQFLIALHNSWTPNWYKQLAEEEVLAADCLLSKTLKNVVNQNHHQFRNKPISFRLKAALLFQKIKKKFS